ncbi:aldolase [Castellaniella sp. UC4442_H9]|jgi:L-fuculose-phosphate aldolase|nr:aldolase [Castellaniella sp.]
MKTDTLSKDTIVSNVIRQMNSGLEIEPITIPKALTSAAHILFMLGHTTESGLAGQVSARGEDPDTYWTQQWGTGFEEVTENNLLLVDGDLTVLKGKGMANPAARFHSWIYRNHPDVKCILHAHPLNVSALSMLEIPLVVSHMDTCVLHDEVAFVEKWPGIPVGNGEGKLISAALANKKTILLAHHGMLVTGGSVEEACVLAVMFERAAKLQLMALASGDIKPIPHDLAAEARDWISTPQRHRATFAYYSRLAEREIKKLMH